jgi:hypothetical protein
MGLGKTTEAVVSIVLSYQFNLAYDNLRKPWKNHDCLLYTRPDAPMARAKHTFILSVPVSQTFRQKDFKPISGPRLTTTAASVFNTYIEDIRKMVDTKETAKYLQFSCVSASQPYPQVYAGE